MRTHLKDRIREMIWAMFFIGNSILQPWYWIFYERVVLFKDGYIQIWGGFVVLVSVVGFFIGLIPLGIAFEKDEPCKKCGKTNYSMNMQSWALDRYCDDCFERLYGDMSEELYGKRKR